MPGYGMMVSLALGDSFGLSFEYASPEFVTRFNHPEQGYVQHPKYKKIKPGQFSDDTQFSIAIAELLLSGQPHTAMNLAMHLVRSFQRDPRTGYSGNFYKVLCDCTAPGNTLWIAAHKFLITIVPHSNKSGGAMRAAPCGLLKEPAEVVDTALWQASITHATKDGMASAAAAALLVWACRHNCDPGFLPSFLSDHLPGYPWAEPWFRKVGSPGLESVRAALTALMQHDNMLDLLKACIAFTGDVDTVATICLAAASLHPQIEQNLPEPLFDKLENGKYGRDFLVELDRKLMAKFPA